VYYSARSIPTHARARGDLDLNDRGLRLLAVAVCFVLFLNGTAASQTQTPKPATASAKQKASPGFIDRVLKYLGISDSPGTLKGPGDEVVKGDLWVADLISGSTHLLARGSYRSPVFVLGSSDVLALNGSDLMLFSAASGDGKKLSSIMGPTKLVGSGMDDPDNVLLLRSGGAGSHPQVAILSISTGKVTPIEYDAAASADLQMVENLEGWTRIYGDKQVSVRRQTKQALSGPVEWSDVFLKADGQEPVNVSRCNGANCGQPSLSADGRFVVFVKSGAA